MSYNITKIYFTCRQIKLVRCRNDGKQADKKESILYSVRLHDYEAGGVKILARIDICLKRFLSEYLRTACRRDHAPGMCAGTE